jgi:hypothetical protein
MPVLRPGDQRPRPDRRPSRQRTGPCRRLPQTGRRDHRVGYRPGRAVNPNKQAETTGGHDNRAGEPCRLAAGTGRQQARGQAARAAPMRCPQCGEPAASRTPAEQMPREARRMQCPQWSHTAGSALCPASSGGYQPAQPVAAGPAASDTTRLDPPPGMCHRWLSSGTGRESEPG